MPKILIVWDVKSRGSPATKFYRALFGYNYETLSGTNHSNGALDKMPDDVWERVNQSVLLIEEEYSRMVEKIFKEFNEHLTWCRFMVEEE